MKLKRIQIHMCVWTVILFSLSLLMPSYKSTLILSIPAAVIVAICLVDGVRSSNYFFFCMIALIFEIYLAVNLHLLLGGGKETSWRTLYNLKELNDRSIRYIFLSLLILLFIYFLRNYGESRGKVSVLQDVRFRIDGVNIRLFEVIFAVLLLYYLIRLPSLMFRSFAADQGVMILSLFRACFLLGLILFRYRLKDRILLGENILAIVVILVMALKGGYRYLIVEWFLLIVFLGLTFVKRIRGRNLLILLFLGLGFYFVLSFIKSRLTGKTVMEQMFSHERNLFYSLNALLLNLGKKYEYTYWSTVKNILPKAITGSSDPNTGGILVKYIFEFPSGINMGGFYLAEAFANMHEPGIYIISLFFGIVCSKIERRKNRRFRRPYAKTLFFFFYLVIISQVFSIVCYGSSNYVKLIVYIMLLAAVVFMPFQKKVRNIP